MASESDYEQVVELLQASISGMMALYLFGSVATGSENKESDIDLAFLATEKCEQKKCWNIAQVLAAKLNRDVDLVDLKTANTILKKQIVTEGLRLWVAEGMQTAVDSYEVTIMSQYQHLQAERHSVVEGFLREYKE